MRKVILKIRDESAEIMIERAARNRHADLFVREFVDEATVPDVNSAELWYFHAIAVLEFLNRVIHPGIIITGGHALFDYGHFFCCRLKILTDAICGLHGLDHTPLVFPSLSNFPRDLRHGDVLPTDEQI